MLLDACSNRSLDRPGVPTMRISSAHISLERFGSNRRQRPSGGSSLAEVTELHLLAQCLRALTEPENSVALVSILRGELFGFSDADLYALRRAGGSGR